MTVAENPFEALRSDLGEAPVAGGRLQQPPDPSAASPFDTLRSDSLTESLHAKGTAERGGTEGDLSRLEAFGYGGVTGGAAAAEFTAGAALAFRATPMLPAPARAIVTGAGGLVAASALHAPTKRVLEVAGVPGYEDLPEGYRPAFVAGETFVGSLIPAVGMTGLAKSGFRLKGTSRIGSFFNKSLDAVAKQSLKTTTSIEAGSAAGAAFLGMGAEEFAPGDFKARFAAEVVGGMANPGKWGAELLRWSWYRGKGAVTALAPTRWTGIDPDVSAKTEATRFLKHVYDELNLNAEDVESLTKTTAAEGFFPEATWAQRTGSEPLAVLQNALVQRSKIFGIEVQKRTEQSLDSVHKMIGALTATGDPQALVAAADMRQAYVKTMLEGLVSNAKDRARLAVANLPKDDLSDARRVSQAAWDILDDVRKVARDVEKPLYAAVQRDSVINTKGLKGFLAETKKLEMDLNPEDVAALPAYLRSFITRMRKATGEVISEETLGGLVGVDGKPLSAEQFSKVTAKDFLNFRSAMMDLASTAANDNKLNRAQLLGEYVDKALDLLDKHFAVTGDDAYDIARAYTREFHDVFTRSFVGSSKRTGEHGLRTHPEVLLRKALASGKDATNIRLEEMEAATRFLDKATSEDAVAQAVNMVAKDYNPEQAVVLMLDAQERMLRLVMTETVDPLTGRANARAIAKFMRGNEDLFDRMPGLRDDLERVIKSEVDLRDLEKNIPRHGTPEVPVKGLGIDADQAVLSAKLSGVDRPDKIVHAMLNSASPETGLAQLADLAKGDPAAIKGLRSSILTAAGDTVEAKVARLNEPMGPGLPTLLDSMKAKGIVDDEIHANMKKFIDEYDKLVSITDVSRTIPLPGEEETVNSLVVAFFSRLSGQRLLHESGIAPGGAGAISAYSAVSRISQKILDKMPTERVIKVLEHAMVNPDLANDLMRDLTKLTDREAYRLMGRVHGYLIRAGLIPVIRDEDDTIADRGLSQ